ncbi:MAG: serine/threonine protein kinase [Actinobacteria bacterium]|nr:serine/threonine protein kinase [Actinomycetota bacterium]
MGELFAGRYEFIDPIGEGGMGTVWRVWDHREAELLAAKVLRQSDAGALLRFVREQGVRIHHPNVLVPRGWAGMDDRVLFTMPLVSGGSVATVIGDHGALPPIWVAEVLRQLLSALVVVHDRHLVHRDIKPANLLLDATGTGRPHVWLSDFGIAVDLNGPRFTETGIVTGTPGYLSPELESHGEPTPAADLYAAGQVAATMLTGQRPAERHDWVPPADCPPALAAIVAALTCADPHGRPPSAAVALRSLDDPALQWHEGAAGEVEVFDQLPVLPEQFAGESGGMPHAFARQGPTDEVPTRRRPAPAVTVRSGSAVTPQLPEDDHAPPTTRRTGPRAEHVPLLRRLVLPVGGVLLGVLTTVALVLWNGSRDGGEENPQAPTSSSVPTPSPSATPSMAPSTTPPPTTPSPSVLPSPSGSLRVGTVVVNVGQPCSFSEVGLREHTMGGVLVQCTLGSDGAYTWASIPG